MESIKGQPSTVEIAPESFVQLIAEQQFAVLHFWAGWNAHDRLMNNALAELVPRYADRIFFGSVDVDNPGHLRRCQHLRILNMPALVVFVHGRHSATIIGMRSQEEIRCKLEEWLALAQS